MARPPSFPPFDEGELSRGFAHLREDERYKDLVPPKRTLKVDWFLLDAIGREVAKRRTPDIRLAMLVGTVVREFVPDTSPERRRLGKAYRDTVMYMFRVRKEFQSSSRRVRVKATRSPEDHPGQPRLL
jgi:hypothetical protein